MGNTHRPQLRLREVEQGHTLLWLDDDWLDDDLYFLRNHPEEANGVGVSPHQGCRTLVDLSRLVELRLKALSVPYPDAIDVSAARDMDSLEYLAVGAARSLDLRRLRSLRHLRAGFSRSSRLPGSWPSLESCSWSACSPRTGDLTFMGNAPRLTKLELIEGSIRSLHGIEDMPLRELDLYGLQSLWSVEGLGPVLELIRLEKCKAIRDLSPIGRCPAVHTLVLADCGEVPSLRFIRSLPMLHRVVITGDTRIVDGDLHPLVGIPEVHMKDRRGYNLRIDEIRRAAR